MLLLKLGEREHLEMLRRGLLYMNSLAFFKSLEADQTRRDRREGIDYIYQPGDCEFVLDPGIPGFEKIRASAASGLAGVQIRTRRTSSCNIFCMFAVTKPIEGSLFPKSHPWFGDSFLIFTQTQEFLSRVEAAANHQGLKGECRLVQYYDENNYTGEAGRFHHSTDRKSTRLNSKSPCNLVCRLLLEKKKKNIKINYACNRNIPNQPFNYIGPLL